jgi:hypothetical protein
VTARRRELIERLEELDRTFVSTEAALRSARRTHRRFNRRVGSDKPIEEAFVGLSVPEARLAINEQLAVLEEARHRVRTAIIAVGLEEGLSIGKMGRLFGFSRQLAARFAREAKELGEMGQVGGFPG